MAGAMQDITTLRDTEKRFTVAFGQPAGGLHCRASDGMFLEVNDKYEAFFGWTRDDLVGHTTLEIGLWVDLAAREAAGRAASARLGAGLRMPVAQQVWRHSPCQHFGWAGGCGKPAPGAGLHSGHQRAQGGPGAHRFPGAP
jgi:PAS domain-containing protein